MWACKLLEIMVVHYYVASYIMWGKLQRHYMDCCWGCARMASKNALAIASCPLVILADAILLMVIPRLSAPYSIFGTPIHSQLVRLLYP